MKVCQGWEYLGLSLRCCSSYWEATWIVAVSTCCCQASQANARQRSTPAPAQALPQPPLKPRAQGSSAAKKSDVEEFRKLYLASHYIALSSQARQAGLKELAAMQLTSMLRYVGIVPADRAFFEAGIAWKVRSQGKWWWWGPDTACVAYHAGSLHIVLSSHQMPIHPSGLRGAKMCCACLQSDFQVIANASCWPPLHDLHDV